MSNDGTRQNNNWDDELPSDSDIYDINDTEEPRPRRRRLPPEQPPQRVRRPRPTTGPRQSSSPRPRPTTDFGQAQDSPRSQRPRTTTNFSQEQGSQRPRTYTDEEQRQERPRSSADMPRSSRPLPETDVPQSPRPRSTTGTRSRQAQTRLRPRSTVNSQREQRKQRPRRVWPWLLIGCFGGIVLVVLGIGIAAYLAVRSATGGGIGIGGIGGTSTYTQPHTQSVPLAIITQLQIQNQIGDVTITVDPNATTPTVSTTKIVKATSQSDANNQFNAISVQVEPAGTSASTLAVHVSVPNSSTVFSSHNGSVNIVITLPPSVNTGNTPVVLNGGSSPITITSTGNVSINGLNGVLNVKNDSGKITVQNALLSPGSTLETQNGDITFTGTVDTVAGSSNNPSIYTISSEVGSLDVTLPANINVILDAYTNTGTISSDFDLSKIKRPDGSYLGPIGSGSAPNALLKLHVSTGNIVLHKR